VVLSDIGLPDMEGYELATRLRAQTGWKVPRLIALTGFGSPDHRRRAREAGFDAHLVKPADGPRLRRAIEPPGEGGALTDA
jgi:CheY-like chemotaxis protein